MAGKSDIEFVLSLSATRFNAALSSVVSSSKRAGSEFGRSFKDMGDGAKQFGDRLEQVQQKLSAFSGMKLLGGALAGGALLHYGNEMRKLADEYTNLDSRIKLVSESEQEFAAVKESLYVMSQQTGTAFRSNADAYAKLAASVRAVGGDSKETLTIVDMVNKSLALNGSTTADAASFQLQFAQALGSGVLQGDELRAMLESNGLFARELAKALGTNIAGLREMGSQGELTTDVLRKAFPKMRESIESAYSGMEMTTDRAFEKIRNAFEKIVDESNKASNGTGTIASEISKLAETIDANREGIIQLFSTMISLASKTVGAVANIGQSFAGWQAVKDGRLGFFEFALMDAEELHAWLQKNTAAQNEFKQAAGDALKTISGNQGMDWGAVWKKMNEGIKLSEEQIKSLRKQYQDFVKEAQRLAGELAGRQRSLSAELRDMGRSGMSETSAWKDQKKEAEEYVVAARRAAQEAQQAMASGDTITGKAKFEEAVRLADDAKQAYKSLNTEVKEGDQVVLSKTDALKTAMAGVKQAGELGINVLKQQQDAVGKAMDEMTKKAGAADLTEGMDEAEKKWLDGWQRMRGAGEEAVAAVSQEIVAQQKEIQVVEAAWANAAKSTRGLWVQLADDLQKKLDAATKARTVTVYTNVVEKRALGGLIGAARLAAGGKLAGFGGGDRIPALLEAGEYVIRKEAVARFGAGLFDRLNSLRLPDLSTLAPAANPYTVNVNFALPGGGSIPMQTTPRGAQELREAEARWNRRVSHLGARR